MMRKLVRKEFKPQDALSLLGHTTESIPDVSREQFEILKQQSIAGTWWHEDTIIGCGGIVIYEKGKCEAWSIVNSNAAHRFKRQLLVGSKRFLNEVAKENKIEYMRACWQESFAPEIRWLEHLGFTKESGTIGVNNMKSYIYSRKFKWE